MIRALCPNGRSSSRLPRSFVEQMKEVIGPTTDIPAPDVNTNAKIMGWIMHEYSKYEGFSPGVVTGKPLDLFGSEGRDAATGRGVMDVLAAALEEKGKSFEEVTVAVQGFGNVGSNAALLIAERGAKIVAVADHTGGVANAEGLDVPALDAWVGRAWRGQGVRGWRGLRQQRDHHLGLRCAGAGRAGECDPQGECGRRQGEHHRRRRQRPHHPRGGRDPQRDGASSSSRTSWPTPVASPSAISSGRRTSNSSAGTRRGSTPSWTRR